VAWYRRNHWHHITEIPTSKKGWQTVAFFVFVRSKLIVMFYVYILRSLKDQSFYIGYSSDVAKRLEQHNAGESRYTARKLPWEIFYVESFATKSEAIKREIFFKKQRNREFFLRLREAG